jgi:hypothetical protein
LGGTVERTLNAPRSCLSAEYSGYARGPRALLPRLDVRPARGAGNRAIRASVPFSLSSQRSPTPVGPGSCGRSVRLALISPLARLAQRGTQPARGYLRLGWSSFWLNEPDGVRPASGRSGASIRYGEAYRHSTCPSFLQCRLAFLRNGDRRCDRALTRNFEPRESN